MEVNRQYSVRGLPTTYLIDPDGLLIGVVIGARDWYGTEAKALIAGLLRQIPAPSDHSEQAPKDTPQALWEPRDIDLREEEPCSSASVFRITANPSTSQKILDTVRRAEELGFDSVWVTDHILVPQTLEIIYRDHMLDPLAVLYARHHHTGENRHSVIICPIATPWWRSDRHYRSALGRPHDLRRRRGLDGTGVCGLKSAFRRAWGI